MSSYFRRLVRRAVGQAGAEALRPSQVGPSPFGVIDLPTARDAAENAGERPDSAALIEDGERVDAALESEGRSPDAAPKEAAPASGRAFPPQVGMKESRTPDASTEKAIPPAARTSAPSTSTKDLTGAVQLPIAAAAKAVPAERPAQKASGAMSVHANVDESSAAPAAIQLETPAPARKPVRSLARPLVAERDEAGFRQLGRMAHPPDADPVSPERLAPAPAVRAAEPAEVQAVEALLLERVAENTAVSPSTPPLEPGVLTKSGKPRLEVHIDRVEVVQPAAPRRTPLAHVPRQQPRPPARGFAQLSAVRAHAGRGRY